MSRLIYLTSHKPSVNRSTPRIARFQWPRVFPANTDLISTEPSHKKTCLRGFATKYDLNRPAQLHRLASLKDLASTSIGIILSKQRITKTLIRLPRCAGWPTSLLFAYSIKHVFSWRGSFYSSSFQVKPLLALIHIHTFWFCLHLLCFIWAISWDYGTFRPP